MVIPMGDTDRERREPALNRDVDRARRASNVAFGGNACIDVPAYSDIPGRTPGAWGTTADDAVSAISTYACGNPLKSPTLDHECDC